MLRIATHKDINSLNDLIKRSATTLCRNDYSAAEIESAIEYIFEVDKQLIEDKTYFAVEKHGRFIACGGWSKRKRLFGGDQCELKDDTFLDQKVDSAKIRAYFVHPEFARQGLGSQLLRHCEQNALIAGFSKTEMMATLSGAKLYEKFGYEVLRKVEYKLPNKMVFTFLHMQKNLI